VKPPTLHIPIPAASSVSATPAAVSPAAAAAAGTPVKARQHNGKVSPLPSRPTGTSGSSKQQQARAAAGATAKSPAGGCSYIFACIAFL
jgi:hypothetical protein